ncbi:ankyrin repeat-containing domain protein [Xylaria cubensis]|nr:ankyrin repeat-containing domain protein [Xylaria cubensis]
MSTSKDKAREDLLNNKILIHRLYHVDDLTVEETVTKLQDRGLNVNNYSLHSMLQEWGYGKNLKKDTWKSLDGILRKREIEDEKSEVIHCCKRVKESTLGKERNRYQDNPTLKQSAQPQNPPCLPTGSRVVVCTPPPHSMEFDYSKPLPWQEFANGKHYENLHQIAMKEGLNQNAKDHSTMIIQPNSYHTLLSLSTSVSYNSSCTSNSSSPPVSELAASIGAIMPEAYRGENLQRAQCLIHGSRDKEFVFQCLTLLIYAFSNNIIDPFSMEHKRQWEAAFAIIRNSGILNKTVHFKQFNSPTINGFAENLFYVALDKIRGSYASLEEESVAIVKWLLECGQNPNNIRLSASDSYEHPRTPLQQAVMQNRLDLVENLLKMGADVNMIPSLHGISSLPLSPLEMATRHNPPHTLQSLLERGASANIDQALHLAIRNSNLDAAKLLMNYGAKPCAAYKTQGGPVYEDTALNVAAATGWKEVQFVLSLITSQNPNKTLPSLTTADTLVAAATSNDSDVFGRLPVTALLNGHDITPLHAAVLSSNIELCKSHVPYYDLRTLTTPIPPLWLACLLGNEEITGLFISNGANVNDQAMFSEKYKKILCLELETEPGPAPLDCIKCNPCQHGHFSCALRLIEAGATLTGSELFIAASNLHLGLLSAALDADADPNARNDEGQRPLQLALEASGMRSAKYAIVEKLLEKKAKVSQEEIIGSIRKDSRLLELLLKFGGNLRDPSGGGITPLETAICSGDIRTILNILEQHPEFYDPGSICAALSSDMHQIALHLVRNRLSQNPPNIVEMTALGMAAAHGDLKVFREFLKYATPSQVSYLPGNKSNSGDRFWGKSCSSQGSPLALCAMLSTSEEKNPFLPISRVFLSDGHTTNYWMDPAGWEFFPKGLSLVTRFDAFCQFLEKGFQPDYYAWFAIAVRGEVHYAKALLERGYKLEVQPGGPPTADLDPLCESIRHGNLAMFKILLKAGETFIKEHPYSIHLSTAIRYTQWDMMEELLRVGANVNGHPPEGLTALQVAVKYGKLEAVNRLIKAGANVNEWNQDVEYGRSPLQSATEQVNLKMIECLVEAEAEVNAPAAPKYGATALQLAAIMGHVGLAQRFLQLKADINAPGAKVFGRTALEGAAQYGRIDMLQLLIDSGACLTGNGRRQYIRSILLARNRVFHYTAQELLINSGGWSDSDDEALQVEAQRFQEELRLQA